MSSHSISVVIPTYNCSGLLPEAIRSAYAQSLRPTEVIVIDDGCTDDTNEVLNDLTPSLPATFVHIRQPNGGEASARNRGLSIATGDLVAFLDQDDIWLPDKLERQVQLFDEDQSLALTFTAYTRVSDQGRDLVEVSGWEETPEHALQRLMDGCCITPSTVVARRDVLLAMGPFDETLRLGNDWEMWVRIAAAQERIGYLAEPLTEYRWHETNMSRDQRKIADAALTIFPRLFRSGKLPQSLQRRERRCIARWHLIAACSAFEAGQGGDTRSSLAAAIRSRPASARPGWALIYAKSLLH